MGLSPLYRSILEVIVRALLGPLVIWLNAHGLMLTSDQTTQIVIDVLTVLGVLVWAIKRWVKAHRELNTALGSDVTMTPAEVTRKVDNGVFASARTPANQVPEVKTNP
jgi:hypothetical protein